MKAHNNERVLSLFYDRESEQLMSTSKDKHVNVYRVDKGGCGEGTFLREVGEETYFLNKVTQQKEEDLNIIY